MGDRDKIPLLLYSCGPVCFYAWWNPEAAFIVAGEFNQSNLKTVLPKFHQHVSCPTWGDKSYSNMADAYKAIPLPHLPKYTPLIKCVKRLVRTVKVWPEGADSALQHRLEHRLECVCHTGLKHRHQLLCLLC